MSGRVNPWYKLRFQPLPNGFIKDNFGHLVSLVKEIRPQISEKQMFIEKQTSKRVQTALFSSLDPVAFPAERLIFSDVPCFRQNRMDQ